MEDSLMVLSSLLSNRYDTLLETKGKILLVCMTMYNNGV